MTSANVKGIVRLVLKEKGQHAMREKMKTMTLETSRSSRKWQRFLLYSERMVRGVRVWERHVLQ